jgi:hypothetical protein
MFTVEPAYYYVPVTEGHLQAEYYWSINYYEYNSDQQMQTFFNILII